MFSDQNAEGKSSDIILIHLASFQPFYIVHWMISLEETLITHETTTYFRQKKSKPN